MWFKGEKTVETVTPPLEQTKVPAKGKILTTVPVVKDIQSKKTVEAVTSLLKQDKVSVKGKILTNTSFKKNEKDPNGILQEKEEIRQLLQDTGASNAHKSSDIPVGTEGKTLSDYFFNIKELLAKRNKNPEKVGNQFLSKIDKKFNELNSIRKSRVGYSCL